MTAQRSPARFEEMIEQPIRGMASQSAKATMSNCFMPTIGDRVVRRPETRDVRVHIYGPLEARLQTVDLLVLGGLNEATWPPETRSDPWLSRPMRARTRPRSAGTPHRPVRA